MLEGKRILLAEDEYYIARDMASALATAGALVSGPAATVAEALRLVIGTAALDGAVLDINLNGEMIFAVADALMARRIPFLFATGYGRDSIPARFDHCRRCEKPVPAEQVAAILFPGT